MWENQHELSDLACIFCYEDFVSWSKTDKEFLEIP